MSGDPKNHETVQARIADFARNLPNSEPHHNNLRAKIFEDMGRISTEPAVDRSYHVEDKYWNETGTVVTHKVGRLAVISATDLQHLHEHDEPDSPEVQMRIRYLQAYKEFEESVDRILAQRSQSTVETEGVLPSHGDLEVAGGYATAVSFTHNETEYILKISHDAATSALQSDDRVLGLALGEHVPHLEQMAALSYIKGVVITERLPGADFTRLPLETASHITDEQLSEAVTTMRDAHKAGIRLDGRAPNYLYDPQQGFGFIDYEINDDTEFQSFTEKAVDFAMALTNIEIDSEPTTNEDYVMLAQKYEARIRLLEQYRDVCAGQISQEEGGDEVAATVNEFIAIMREFTVNAQTPGWIDAQLS